jgi:hypothetical protein
LVSVEERVLLPGQTALVVGEAQVVRSDDGSEHVCIGPRSQTPLVVLDTRRARLERELAGYAVGRSLEIDLRQIFG